MRKPLIRNLMLSAALSCCALPAMAQKLTVESQGQAEIQAKAQALSAKAIAKAIGEAPSGKGQVVFFRAATSPGAAISVGEAGMPLIELEPGMYFVAQVTPGTHGFDAGGPALGLNVDDGKTRYVQVIRNRAGQPQLRPSSATSFQRAAR
jgi:hypothetical protein